MSFMYESVKVSVGNTAQHITLMHQNESISKDVTILLEYLFSLESFRSIIHLIPYIKIRFLDRFSTYDAILEFKADIYYTVKIVTYNMVNLACLWVNDDPCVIHCIKRDDISVRISNEYVE